jgi:hypothetical protein
MKIAVTGATGFVGRALVDSLIAAGHEVTALVRSPARAAALLPARVRLRSWNAAAPADPAPLRGLDAVVHLAGEGIADRRWSLARKRLLVDSRVCGTGALVAAFAGLAEHERPRVLVAASAIGFYGDRADESLDERSRAGSGFLADLCAAWERETDAAERLGVRTAALRIGVVLGPDGGALQKLLPPFRLGLGGRVGTGQQWMSWIHRTDLVRLIEFALARGDVRGVVNAVAPGAVRNADFTAALGRVLRRPTLFPVPAIALKIALGEMATVLLASQRVAPAVARAHGFAFAYETIEDALAALCADPTHCLRTEEWVAEPVEPVFAFFAAAQNLERLTPPFLRFAVRAVSTPAMAVGTTIDYGLRLHGLPMRWRSRITRWEPNRGFVDEQVSGPYRLWHHTHEFEAWEGGTIVRDIVRYALPLGALGDLLAGPLVRRDLAAIFDYRRAVIRRLFGKDAPHDPAAAHSSI